MKLTILIDGEGIEHTVESPDEVRYTEQSPTEEQKEQARKNIGAMPADKQVLPAVTEADNGKFLRVVNGAWTSAAIPNAEEATF